MAARIASCDKWSKAFCRSSESTAELSLAGGCFIKSWWNCKRASCVERAGRKPNILRGYRLLDSR